MSFAFSCEVLLYVVGGEVTLIYDAFLVIFIQSSRLRGPVSKSLT